MRRHRVHLPELAAGETLLTGPDAQHLAQVLRVREGSPVRAFDGAGLEADGEVVAVEGLGLRLRLEAPRAGEVEPPLAVTLAVALLKGDKLAEVVRRGTELGAAAFALHVSRRCDARTIKPAKLERLRRVAREAAKQSGRSVVPEVRPPVTLAELELPPLSLVADPRAGASLRDAVPDGAERLVCVTGPEGGLEPREIVALRERGATPVRLGARILRAETAPVALAAALLVPEGL